MVLEIEDDYDEEGPSGLYEDIDDEREEAEQEADLQTKIRTTFTCWCCAFRVMGAKSTEVTKLAVEHKDCTFENPLHGVPEVFE